MSALKIDAGKVSTSLEAIDAIEEVEVTIWRGVDVLARIRFVDQDDAANFAAEFDDAHTQLDGWRAAREQRAQNIMDRDVEETQRAVSRWVEVGR